MTFAEREFVAQNDRVPRGERVAAWVEDCMRLSGASVGEIAFRVNADKRDVRRLLADRSCGARLEDALAAYYGWDFVEAVMTPIVGADPLTARERELAARQAQASALHARLERERALRSASQDQDRQHDRARILRGPSVGFEDGVEFARATS